LAVCKKLIAEGYMVVGTVRSDASRSELESAGANVIAGFDIATSDPQDLCQELDETKIDLLVIAAGIQEVDNLNNVGLEGLRRQMDVNAYGPLMVVQAVRPYLRSGGHVALIASKMGSIANVTLTGGELYGYRMSKAALNMAGATMAHELKSDQVSVSLIHPGVVFTNMLRTLREGRGVAPEKIRDNSITPEASADGIYSVIQQCSLDNTGQYWAADTGKHLEW